MVSTTTPRHDLIHNGIRITAISSDEDRRIRISEQVGISDVNQIPTQTDTTSYFDARGKLTTEQSAVAKRVADVGNIFFYLRFCTSGPTKGRLLDPRDMYFGVAELTKTVKTTGRLKYEYERVSEKAFNDYLNYLVNGDKTFLKRAEGERLDG